MPPEIPPNPKKYSPQANKLHFNDEELRLKLFEAESKLFKEVVSKCHSEQISFAIFDFFHF